MKKGVYHFGDIKMGLADDVKSVKEGVTMVPDP